MPQEGNHLEYQIPNVHPAAFASVKHGGKVEIQQTLNGKTITTNTDVYSWSFGLGKWYAFVTKSNGTSAILNRWVAEAEGKNFTNDYFNHGFALPFCAIASQDLRRERRVGNGRARPAGVGGRGLPGALLPAAPRRPGGGAGVGRGELGSD